MTMNEADDELLRRLGRLRVAEADATRLERVRMRCHAALQQQQQRTERRKRRAAFVARVLEPTLVGGFSAGYLLAILLVLLGMHGHF